MLQLKLFTIGRYLFEICETGNLTAFCSYEQVVCKHLKTAAELKFLNNRQID